MSTPNRAVLSLVFVLTLLAPPTSAVGAQSLYQELPPLPEWPIIGPILRRLGITTPAAEPEVVATPDPDLPEYRITSFEDIERLEAIEPNERVRIIASDADLNRMAAQVLRDADLAEDARLNLAFDPELVVADFSVSSTFLDRLDLDIEIPAVLRGRRLDVSAAMAISTADCSVNLTFEELRVNKWRLGLRPLATRMVNERIPDFWSSDVCAENVYVTNGEIAVEGFRQQ